jgi:1,2-phenylacetyl-CoA epoxidase catalytic subunit
MSGERHDNQLLLQPIINPETHRNTQREKVDTLYLRAFSFFRAVAMTKECLKRTQELRKNQTKKVQKEWIAQRTESAQTPWPLPWTVSMN